MQKKTVLQKIGLFLGPVVFVYLMFMDLEPGNPVVTRMAAVAALMSIYWITEAIPLFATALLPLILYPLLGIMKGKAITPVYFNSTIFLFIGGFMIALTMEKWNLHKRIALRIIRIVGGSPSMIVLGFMLASAFLSMWISNTATAVMMVPMGLAIILKMEEEFGENDTRKFAVSLMLGIAYACSMGGIATLVGTPPNLSFVRIFEIIFPQAEPVSFGQWMLMGVPIMLIMGAAIWIMLTRIFFRPPSRLKVDRTMVSKEYEALGHVSFEEKAVFLVFILTALLWIFRKKLEIGFITIPGWSQILPWPGFIDDGTVAIFMAMTLFFVPVKDETSKETTVMGSDVILHIPWHIVILFGGGFALAKGFQATGLSDLIGVHFKWLEDTSIIIVIPAICGSLTFLTELTSNTATAEMILPVLASIACAMKVNPLILMIPATLAASCAFMMPVATPPNAIIFGSGRVKIIEMVMVGFFINILGIAIITAIFYFLGSNVFSIDFANFPEWAQAS